MVRITIEAPFVHGDAKLDYHEISVSDTGGAEQDEVFTIFQDCIIPISK